MNSRVHQFLFLLLFLEIELYYAPADIISENEIREDFSQNTFMILKRESSFIKGKITFKVQLMHL